MNKIVVGFFVLFLGFSGSAFANATPSFMRALDDAIEAVNYDAKHQENFLDTQKADIVTIKAILDKVKAQLVKNPQMKVTDGTFKIKYKWLFPLNGNRASTGLSTPPDGSRSLVALEKLLFELNKLP